MSDQIFELSVPITSHKGQINSLTLRQPKARAFIKYGIPFKHVIKGEGAEQEVRTEFDTKAMFGFLAEMTGLDEITLENIAACDVMSLFWRMTDVISNPPKANAS